MPQPLTPQLVLAGYCQGLFPMARHRGGAIDWYSPDPRAVMPLDTFRARRSLQKRIRNGRFTITCDQAFSQVIHACAQPRPQQPESWISPAIERSYGELARLGYAHSVEAWLNDEQDQHRREPQLVGGLYGVSIGAAFFGESMFSRVSDASQVCLVWLVRHLRARGYALLDVQFRNPHIEQFGVVEIPREAYLVQLRQAVQAPVTWSDRTT